MSNNIDTPAGRVKSLAEIAAKTLIYEHLTEEDRINKLLHFDYLCLHVYYKDTVDSNKNPETVLQEINTIYKRSV